MFCSREVQGIVPKIFVRTDMPWDTADQFYCYVAMSLAKPAHLVRPLAEIKPPTETFKHVLGFYTVSFFFFHLIQHYICSLCDIELPLYIK